MAFDSTHISAQLNLQSTIYEILNNRATFNENPSMRAIAKILRARASEHSSKFCEQIKQRPHLRALENFKGRFDALNDVLFYNWYLLGVKIHLSHTYQTRLWCLFGWFSKISDEHPRSIFICESFPGDLGWLPISTGSCFA